MFTNTAPVDAYRGAGRPEATYVVERIVEQAARDMKMSPAEIRRKNFITSFPYATPVGLTYDVGGYAAHLDKAMQMADVVGFPARKVASAAKGKKRGLGYACYIEACGIAPSNVAGALGARAGLYEAGEVRVNPTGGVTVFTGSHSHGQGHETTFAQVVAARLGIPVGNVEIVHGDTGRVPFGMGTYGSRSLAVGGTAIVKAVDKVYAKGKKIAAHLLEAADSDIEFADGEFRVAGTDKKVAWATVTLTAYAPHNFPLDKLETGAGHRERQPTSDQLYPIRPAATSACRGRSTTPARSRSKSSSSPSMTSANIVNPMIIEGQVHGGIAQNLGQAMMERATCQPAIRTSSSPCSYMDCSACRARSPSRASTSPRHIRRAATTRSASRAAARQERSGRRRPTSTR